MKIPEKMTSKISMNEEYLLTTAKPRILNTKLSFRWRAIKDFNSLPLEIRKNQSLPSFKRQVKSWIKGRRAPEPGLSN